VEPDEEQLTKGLRRIQHMCSPEQVLALLPLLDPSADLPDEAHLDEQTRRLLLMFDFSLWGRNCGFSMATQGVARLKANPMLCEEVGELLDCKRGQIQSVPPELQLPFDCPLTLHAQYTRDEIMAGLGYWTLSEQKEMREGVVHIPSLRADAFLVTLNKTETDYSPTTMYEDYAISDTLFHWQSQSQTSDTSETAHRYIHHSDRGHTILLFVREHKNVNGLSSPYYFLGPVDYVNHTGSRPLSFVWQLQHPMPARLLRRTARMAVA
jgi:hypothetical protein